MTTKDRVTQEIERVQAEMSQIINQMVTGPRWITHTQLYRQHAWKPPTDVFESEEEIVVIVEVPGMREEDFTIMFADDILTINGTRPAPESAAHRIYQQMEICYGDFISQVHIPWSVDTDYIEALYNAGFLTITLPRINRTTKRVPVTLTSKESVKEN